MQITITWLEHGSVVDLMWLEHGDVLYWPLDYTPCATQHFLPCNILYLQTASEFKEQYMANLEDFTFEPTSYYAYDAVWSFAFAVTRSDKYFL